MISVIAMDTLQSLVKMAAVIENISKVRTGSAMRARVQLTEKGVSIVLFNGATGRYAVADLNWEDVAQKTPFDLVVEAPGLADAMLKAFSEGKIKDMPSEGDMVH